LHAQRRGKKGYPAITLTVAAATATATVAAAVATATAAVDAVCDMIAHMFCVPSYKSVFTRIFYVWH